MWNMIIKLGEILELSFDFDYLTFSELVSIYYHYYQRK
tara:strand:- start:150 stop:263 length:114 start_codon:yes stop_codon:yes gene_type:complete